MWKTQYNRCRHLSTEIQDVNLLSQDLAALAPNNLPKMLRPAEMAVYKRMRTLAKSGDINVTSHVELSEGIKRKRKRERGQQQFHPVKHLPLCSRNDKVPRRERGGSRNGTLVILILSRKWTNRLATKIHRNRMHPLQSSTSYQTFFIAFRFYSTRPRALLFIY